MLLLSTQPGWLQRQNRDGDREGYQGLAEGQSPLLAADNPEADGNAGSNHSMLLRRASGLPAEAAALRFPFLKELLPREAELEGSPKASPPGGHYDEGGHNTPPLLAPVQQEPTPSTGAAVPTSG